MSFNSRSYHRNQWRKRALADLAQARDIKARAIVGAAYDWELPRIAVCVSLARNAWRVYLSIKKEIG